MRETSAWTDYENPMGSAVLDKGRHARNLKGAGGHAGNLKGCLWGWGPPCLWHMSTTLRHPSALKSNYQQHVMKESPAASES